MLLEIAAGNTKLVLEFAERGSLIAALTPDLLALDARAKLALGQSASARRPFAASGAPPLAAAPHTTSGPRAGAAAAAGVATGMRYLHSGQGGGAPLMHRDLKPANVLVAADYTPKIADFGESNTFDRALAEQGDTDALTMTMVGTPVYIAPEVVMGDRYNEKADVQVQRRPRLWVHGS